MIGIIGNDVPRQIVLASGALPYRITGLWEAPGDRVWCDLLGAADPVAATIAEELSSADVDGIVVSNDSEAHLRLFYVLRAAGSRVPLHLIDLPRRDSAGSRRFLRHQFVALARFCGEVTGRTPDAQSLHDAAAAEAALGEELERLRARRRAHPPRCSGAQALEATLAAMRVPPSVAADIIRAAGGEDVPTRRRIHMTGSNHPDARLYATLEAAGLIVVSEDHDTGDGAWLGVSAAGDSVEETVDRLIDAHFARIPAATTASSADRARTTRSLAAASGADVAVSLIRDLDESPLWDVVDQREALAADGVELHVADHLRPGEVIDRVSAMAAELSAGRASR